MKIGILGCGYIGQAAALFWKTAGHELSVTTRQKEKIDHLSTLVPHVYCLKSVSLEQFLKNQEILIICLAPDKKEDFISTYLNTTKQIAKVVSSLSKLKQIIYTSSTSIYGDYQGNWVYEQTPPLPLNNQAQILLETENVLLSCESPSTKVCIFRLGEIYGPQREILERLKRRQAHQFPGSGNNYTNLIHQEDVIQALDFALTNQLNGLFNLCNDFHVLRRDFYEKLCLEANIPPIHWNPELKSFHTGNKKVSNEKLKHLGFNFIHP